MFYKIRTCECKDSYSFFIFKRSPGLKFAIRNNSGKSHCVAIAVLWYTDIFLPTEANETKRLPLMIMFPFFYFDVFYVRLMNVKYIMQK